MSSFLISMLKLYGKDPRNLVRHLRKAGGLLARGGISNLGSTVDALSREHAEANTIEALLATFTQNEKMHAASVARWTAALLPKGQRPTQLADPFADAKQLVEAAYRVYGLFDAGYYEATYMADLPEGHGLTPLTHFMLYGRYAGANPNPFFDYRGYLTRYPDIAHSGIDACLHYTFFGWKETRTPGPHFDAMGYLRQNPDVAAAQMSPFQHFMSSGRAEGRSPMPPAQANKTAPAAPAPRTTLDRRGTIVLVSHDSGVGGAQKVVQSIARWILARTGYEVRLVTMKGGGLLHEFKAIAPTFVIADKSPETVADELAEFCGADVRAVFLNSVASGGFLRHWDARTPVLAYIHELPKILGSHPEELGLLRERATTVIGGSEAVRVALRDLFFFEEERLSAVPGFIDGAPETETPDQRVAAKAALEIAPETLVVTACGVLHWRKSPQIFVEVAQKVLARTTAPVKFIWIGGGPDQEATQALIDEKGLGAQVSITGYEPNVQRYLDASDIFLLPSEEDPFPLVCLMAAQARNPIVCFAEAGGMPELVSQGAGKVVPFLDAEAMAEATLAYIDDAEARWRDGARGQEIVRENHTIEATGPRLFAMIRAAAGLKPAVSVVLPNYNYETYLPQRLRSIYAQTFQDFEVILLDDKSPDNSVAVLRDWAERRPATRLVVNEQNSGSPFAQWIRGMEMAESELIWIAEADDYCEPDLLEKLLPAFDDRNVFLGYVKSVPVNAAGVVMGDYEDLYLNRINPGRWAQPYVVTDHEEASLGLGIANCIPNGSSVILRKFHAEEAFRAPVTAMRMCGDWLYYLRAMRGGLVAYVNAPLNYHRRHTNTVTSQTEGSPMYFAELQTVRDYVNETYRLSAPARAKIREFTEGDLNRFGITDAARREEVLAGVMREGEKRLPSILVVAPDLAPGGGQMFVLRLANAWAARGGRAVLVNVGNMPTHDKVLGLIDPRVALIRETALADLDLVTICARFDIDLVHSSIWWADKYVRRQIAALPEVGWITSMHGCHETILANPAIDPEFADDIAFLKNRLDAWVYTAEKNTAVFEAYGWPERVSKIANGVPIRAAGALSRAALGLREDAVVLCLATRAIESKGWFAAVEMVETLNAEGHAVDLMLIGEGPARDEIAARAPEHVRLYGHVDNLQDYIATCDIGILPSFFVGESMPLVLLEMIGLGKPVVATDVGGIPDMIGTGPEAAGLMVPLHEGGLDIPAFTGALRGLVTAPERRAALGEAAARRFAERYTEEKMMRDYTALYRQVLARKLKGECA